MNKFVFQKGCENIQGSMYGIAKDNIDLASRGVNENVYKIIDASDAEYEFIRLDQKNCYYNNDGLVWNDGNCSFASLEALQESINGMSLSGFDHNSAYDDCINELKTKTFDNYTFPLVKTIPEIAEEKGITWVSHYEFL